MVQRELVCEKAGQLGQRCPPARSFRLPLPFDQVLALAFDVKLVKEATDWRSAMLMIERLLLIREAD
jgi:hypothetical protein